MAYYWKLVNRPIILYFLIVVISLFHGVLLTKCYASYSELNKLGEEIHQGSANAAALIETVDAMINNTNYCSHCILFHGTADRLKDLIHYQRRNIQMNILINTFRNWISTLSIFNSIVIFVIFGGPKSISAMSLLSAIVIHVSNWIVEPHEAFYLELSVTVVTFTVFVRSLYSVMVTIIEIVIETDRQRQNDKRRWWALVSF